MNQKRMKKDKLTVSSSDEHQISDPESLAFLDNIKGPERALSSSFMDKAQQRLGGFEMNNVRVFEDKGLEELGQPAYARGNEIHVAPGHFNESTLMHEATHLAQQSAGMTSNLESGAQRVAAGGSFTGASTGPVSASAAPAQGIFGWGRRKRAKAQRKEMERQQMEAQMHADATQHLQRQRMREEQEQRVAMLSPQAHKYKDQLSSAPTYSHDEQNDVLGQMKVRAQESSSRKKNADAFANYIYGSKSTADFSPNMGRRIEAMYQTDSMGGIGDSRQYNSTMFDTLKNVDKLTSSGATELDEVTCKQLGYVFSNTMQYAEYYKDKSEKEIRLEAFQRFADTKRMTGEIHVLSDVLRGLSPETKQKVWEYGGYKGDAKAAAELLTRVTMRWKEGEHDIETGFGGIPMSSLFGDMRGPEYEGKESLLMMFSRRGD